VTVILRCIDHIRLLLGALAEAGREPDGDDKDLIGEINAVADGAPAPGAAPVAASGDAPVFDEAGFPVAAELLAEVAQALGPVVEGDATPEPEVILEPVRELRPPPAAKAEQPREALAEAKEPVQATSSIRVNVEVIENLMTLISELVLTRNQLMQLQRSHKGNEFKVPLQRLSHITSELQDGVTRMRMQPIGSAWAKLPRIVRDLCIDAGKKIDLVQRGADTELDRQVLELIKDPLTHMIRNSADHGVEDPATRKAAGKPETGTILLEAYHESGHIFIRIADDGRGLNVDRIRQKALANGLVTEAELATLSEKQILQFIFRPGFSTAEKVTSVSGRGVGMDVVRTNIERIGGTIEMTSVAGEGTTFLIKIPLTLAIVSALIVQSAGESFALPQINVVELVRAGARSGARIETIKDAPVLRLRDRLLPLVSLRGLLNLGEAGEGERDRFIVVTELGSFKFGIVVDRVFDTEEIVVKPVAPILRGNSYYAGNTILGDGSVIMILDPNGIASVAGQARTGNENAQAAASAAHQGGDLTSLLLFRAGGTELKAVTLDAVSRIEEVDASAIEHVGGRPVVQYRQQLMPLVLLGEGQTFKSDGKQPLLVFTDQGQSLGIVVDEVVDIARDNVQLELAPRLDGLMGSAIVAGKATDLVDIRHYLANSRANWFEGDAPRVLEATHG
jgi:two-component system chemotaxis sensor kinase CheA